MGRLLGGGEEAGGGEGLGFTGGGGGGGGDQDQSAVAVGGGACEQFEAYFGADGAAAVEEGFGEVEFCGNGFDREQLRVQKDLTELVWSQSAITGYGVRGWRVSMRPVGRKMWRQF